MMLKKLTHILITGLTLFALGCGPVAIGQEEVGDRPVTGKGSGASLSPFITDGQLDHGHPTVGMVLLSGSLCTGTLVGRRTVVTAGHCIGSSPMTFKAMGVTYNAVRAVAHPGYNRNDLSNDIAVLVLDRNVGNIQPTPIATTGPQVGQRVVLSGYGKSSGYNNDSGVKRMGSNTISKLTSTTLWYHGTGGGVSGTCNGDSGGPAFTLHNGQEVLSGVTSWGDKYCQQYGVDTRVDAYRQWIQQVAGNDVVLQGAGSNPPGGQPGPTTGEGQSCASSACKAGLTCAAVYHGSMLKGRFCMERCTSLGNDPACDGAEICTRYQPGVQVCFSGSQPQTGYTNVQGQSAPPASPAPPAQGCGDSEESAAFRILNQERLIRGIPALTCAPAGQVAARAHSRDMCQRNYFSHTSPEGQGVNHRLGKAGAKFSGAGENIAIGSHSGTGVHQIWMQSPPHRNNRLNPYWNRVAMGRVICNGNRPIWTEVLLR